MIEYNSIFCSITTCKNIFEFQSDVPNSLRDEIERCLRLYDVEYEFIGDNKLEIRNVKNFGLMDTVVSLVRRLIEDHNKDAQ